MKSKLSILLLLAACQEPTTAGQVIKALSVDCVTPEEFGAIVDDDRDDRLAVQAAIDSGAPCVHLNPGRYDISRKPELGTKAINSLVIDRGMRLEGNGTLSMFDTGYGRDWTLLSITGTGVVVRGLRFDGSRRNTTVEQTHLVQLNPGATTVVLEDLTMTLPPLPAGASGGDCIRLLGSYTERVSDVLIENVVGENCDRSFIGIQRGVNNLRIADVTSVLVGDQALDMEPTGGDPFTCTAIVSDITVQDSEFARGKTAGYTGAVSGEGCAVARNITFDNVRFKDGGLHIIDAERVTLNRVSAETSTPTPALHIRKRAQYIRVFSSTFTRIAGPGPVIHAHSQSGSSPTDFLMVDSAVTQPSPANAIVFEDLVGATILGSEILYTGPDGDQRPQLVLSKGVQRAAGQLTVLDTFWVGVTKLATASGLAPILTPILVRCTGGL